MLFERPTAARTLTVQPALESWDRAASPSQARLAAFLDSLADWPSEFPPEKPLALELIVGLPSGQPLTSGGRDLDNYLLPVIRRFGSERFHAVFGRKVHGESTLAVGALTRARDSVWSPQLMCRTKSAGDSSAWKREVADACAAAAPSTALPGGLAVHVHFRLSARRNWTNQWKPAIDALGAVLGVPDPSRPYRVDDDRIVSLALTRSIDEALGWDIELQARWGCA